MIPCIWDWGQFINQWHLACLTFIEDSFSFTHKGQLALFNKQSQNSRGKCQQLNVRGYQHKHGKAIWRGKFVHAIYVLVILSVWHQRKLLALKLKTDMQWFPCQTHLCPYVFKQSIPLKVLHTSLQEISPQWTACKNQSDGTSTALCYSLQRTNQIYVYQVPQTADRVGIRCASEMKHQWWSVRFFLSKV